MAKGSSDKRRDRAFRQDRCRPEAAEAQYGGSVRKRLKAERKNTLPGGSTPGLSAII